MFMYISQQLALMVNLLASAIFRLTFQGDINLHSTIHKLCAPSHQTTRYLGARDSTNGQESVIVVSDHVINIIAHNSHDEVITWGLFVNLGSRSRHCISSRVPNLVGATKKDLRSHSTKKLLCVLQHLFSETSNTSPQGWSSQGGLVKGFHYSCWAIYLFQGVRSESKEPQWGDVGAGVLEWYKKKAKWNVTFGWIYLVSSFNWLIVTVLIVCVLCRLNIHIHHMSFGDRREIGSSHQFIALKMKEAHFPKGSFRYLQHQPFSFCTEYIICWLIAQSAQHVLLLCRQSRPCAALCIVYMAQILRTVDHDSYGNLDFPFQNHGQ